MNTNTEYRTIHTKLYSKKAKEILDSVIGQLSDGMWENSPRMAKYWRFARIDTEPNNEVVIKISTRQYENAFRSNFIDNGFNGMSETDILDWFANKIKAIIKTELKDNNCYADNWSRTNHAFRSVYLSYNEKITVADIYLVYEHLKGRNYARHYLAEQLEQVIGKPNSPEAEAAEIVKRQKLEDAARTYASEVAKLDAWKREQIAEIERTYNTRYYEIRNNYATQRDALLK